MENIELTRHMVAHREFMHTLFRDVIDLRREYIEHHGYSESTAESQAVLDTLEGLEAIVELAEHDEVRADTDSQMAEPKRWEPVHGPIIEHILSR